MIRKFLALSLLLFAFPAFAADISYNYLQLGYQKVEIDDDLTSGFDVDGDGLAEIVVQDSNATIHCLDGVR